MIGMKFGNFEIQAKLGSGGMGNVFKALDLDFNRMVALKIAEPADLLAKEDILRFETEAQSMKQLDHQNITPVFGYGQIGSRQYISMKFVEGYTLAHYLKKNKLTFPQIVIFAKQICRGLRYAHQHGIIHRDVKPENILCEGTERLYLSDFGISFSAGEERLTNPGMAMGTPEYMSPEQCQGETITNQTDIYSFGIILYEMITGKVPFSGDKPLAIAWKHVNEQVADPNKSRIRIPEKLIEIISKSLQKDRALRYVSFEALLKDLDEVSFDAFDKSQLLWNKYKKKTTSAMAITPGQKSKWKSYYNLLLLIPVFVLGLLLAPNKGYQEFYITPSNHAETVSFPFVGSFSKEDPWKIELPQESVLDMIQVDFFNRDFLMPKVLILQNSLGQKRKINLNNLNGKQWIKFKPMAGQLFLIFPKKIASERVNMQSISLFGIPL